MAAPIQHRPPWRAGWTAMLISALCRGVLAILVSLLVWSLVPVALGWHVTVVMSGSMEPVLRPGDVVASRPIPVQQVRPGQVLLVDDPDHAGRLRLHRLVKIHPDGTLTLRGDANPADDSTPVQRNAVHGVGALRVPFVGAPAYWARTHQPAKLAGSAVLLLLLLAGACTRRDDDQSPEDIDDDSASGSQPDADYSEPAAVVEEFEAAIGRAAFVSRPVRLAAIGAITLGLVGVATGVPALAAPFNGNTSTGSMWSAAATFGVSCQAAVLADAPYFYLPLDEASGTTAADASGNGRNGAYSSTGVTHTAAGACSSVATSTTLDGSGVISTSQQVAAPASTFTEEIWFKTTGKHGGSLMGYATAGSTPLTDRQLYLSNSSRLVFGVRSGATTTIRSKERYNDGKWHLAAATLSSAGMKLYVDGVLIASDASTTSAGNTAGYWRLGNNTFSDWKPAPKTDGFVGSLNGAAVYSTALSPARIAAHYDAR